MSKALKLRGDGSYARHEPIPERQAVPEIAEEERVHQMAS
jgi:hypothetical protein